MDALYIAASTVPLQPIFAPIWIAWGVLFLAVEFTALWARRGQPDPQKNGGTLSELVWRIVRGYQWYHRVAWLALGAGMAVLTWHFLFQPLS